MAQVPYSPVPDVTAQYQPTPTLHEDAPLAAFGGAVAAAQEKLGGALDQTSQELFTRAQAMQSLKNETDARNSMIDFATKADQRFAQFKTQYNQDAGPEAYAKYQQDIMDLRDQSRQSLNNPMAQKMFDGEASSQTIKSLQWGAFHSAEQLKHYGIATQDASITAASNTAALHPEDEQARAKALADAEAAARTKADLTGIRDPGLVQQEVTKARSTVNSQSIYNMADTGQVGPAKALYDKAMKDSDLTGEDAEKLRTHLYNKENQYGSKSIVDNLYQGNTLTMGQGKVPIEQAKIGATSVEGRGDYSATNPTSTAGGKYQVIDGTFNTYKGMAGLGNMSLAEFRANTPEGHAAQEQFFEKVFTMYQDKFGSFNNAMLAWHYGEGALTKQSDGSWKGNDKVESDAPGYLAKANKALWGVTPPSAREEVVRAEATKLDPNNPILPELAVQRLATQQGTEERLARESAQTANFTVATEIDKQIKSGQPVTLESVQSALPKGTQVDPLKLQKQIYQAQNADDNVTPQRDANYNRLQGMALAVDPEGFKDVKLHDENLTGEQRGKLLKLQGDIIAKNVVADPAYKGAIRDGGVIATANSVGAGPANPEQWKEFTGALAEEIRFARAQGKSITNNDVQDMANKLVQEKAGTGWLGTNYRADKVYETPLHLIPQHIQDKALKELKNGKPDDYNPSSAEIETYAAKVIYAATVRTNGKPL